MKPIPSNIRLVIYVLGFLTSLAILGTFLLKWQSIDVPASYDDVIKMGLTAIGTLLAREAAQPATQVEVMNPPSAPIPVETQEGGTP